MTQNETKFERIPRLQSQSVGRAYPSGKPARSYSIWYVTTGLPEQTDEDSPATPEAALTEIFNEVARYFYRTIAKGPRFYHLGVSHMRFHRGKIYELQISAIEYDRDYFEGLVGAEFLATQDDVTIIFLYGWDKFVDIEGTIRVKGNTFEVFEAVSNLERTRKILAEKDKTDDEKDKSDDDEKDKSDDEKDKTDDDKDDKDKSE